MHVIRLRGPWELVAAAGDAEASQRVPAAQRVTVPCDPAESLGRDYAGCVRLIRPFNAPTNLEPHERVHLVLEGLPASASLALNGKVLTCASGDAPARVDITPHLALHNRLEVTLALPGEGLGEVRLEIG